MENDKAKFELSSIFSVTEAGLKTRMLWSIQFNKIVKHVIQYLVFQMK